MEDLRGQWSFKLPLFCIWAGTAKIQHRLSPPPVGPKDPTEYSGTQCIGTTQGIMSTTNGPMDPQEATGGRRSHRRPKGRGRPRGNVCVSQWDPISPHWPPSVTISHHQLAGPRQHLGSTSAALNNPVATSVNIPTVGVNKPSISVKKLTVLRPSVKILTGSKGLK